MSDELAMKFMRILEKDTGGFVIGVGTPIDEWHFLPPTLTWDELNVVVTKLLKGD